jgi:hypothetical protein
MAAANNANRGAVLPAIAAALNTFDWRMRQIARLVAGQMFGKKLKRMRFSTIRGCKITHGLQALLIKRGLGAGPRAVRLANCRSRVASGAVHRYRICQLHALSS